MLVKSLVKEYPNTVLTVYDGELCIWNDLPSNNFNKFTTVGNREIITYELDEVFNDDSIQFRIIVEVL